ncbi:hypothetical protein D9613_003650 [Agrocybe pediades]|uniref:Uncharacterized protein n=1 Tax=Agrocybe pediades TaxID=84607 RepID=A0A8H4VJ16_9AGAR|nr:hypothetical protein D9613_003650 [Agrocybe pediades]KAF9560355.1 hypothetical protein CPC08DRAFT_818313 [Agrocybe pediades]
MQLVQLITLTTLFFTGLVAAIPGVVEMRSPETDLSELLEERGTVHCANIAKIKRPNKYEKEGCTPDRSLGFLSAHNCFNKGGRAYMCVQGGKSFCVQGGSAIKKTGYESGECFQ